MNSITRTQLALLLHSVPHLGPKGIAKILREFPADMLSDSVELSNLKFWNLSADLLQHEYKLHQNAAQCLVMRKDSLLNASGKMAISAEKLGIRVLTTLDPDYPADLKEYEPNPPPILYAYGNLGLLRERKFAAVNSADADARALETAKEYAGILAQSLITVTSHNNQPYQAVALAAKSRNSPVIMALDRGILSAFPDGLEWEPVVQARIWNMRFDREKDLVITKIRLYDPWIGANGRERDKMVFGLADILVGVAIRPGGVMEKECLRAFKKGREVYICEPKGHMPQGNANLIEKGCASLPENQAQSILTTLALSQDEEEI